jgi:hypothetical protein
LPKVEVEVEVEVKVRVEVVNNVVTLQSPNAHL